MERKQVGAVAVVEAEVVLEGMAVRLRFDPKTGDMSWQPSSVHKGSQSLWSAVSSSGSLSFPRELLGLSFGASSVLVRLFSPVKSRCCSSGTESLPRKLQDLLIDFRSHQDNIAFGQAADTWLASSGRPRRLLVIVNPKSGRGSAREVYLRQVLPMLEAAGVVVTMLETNYHRHAVDIARGLNLSLYDGIACVSGDGIPCEVVNGFLRRPDWQRAIQVPIGHIVAGSGNGLAKSALAHGGEDSCCVPTSTFAVIAGKRVPLDVITATQGSKVAHAVLNIGWGLVSDVDVESEKYRWMGGARLTLQTLVRMMALRKYRGRLSYLPASEEFLSSQQAGVCVAGASASSSALGPGGQFLGPSMESLGGSEQWRSIEGEFLFVWGQNVSWAATDMWAAPRSQLCDGCIDVLVLQDCTKLQLLSLFLDMASGKHVSSPLVKYLKVRALKLNGGARVDSKVPGGIVTLDGEVVARGEGAVGNQKDDPMVYGEPINFTVSQGLVQLYVA